MNGDGYAIRSSSNRTSQENGSLRVIRGIRKILLSATLNSDTNINIEKLRLNNLLVYTVKNVTKESEDEAILRNRRVFGAQTALRVLLSHRHAAQTAYILASCGVLEAAGPKSARVL